MEINYEFKEYFESAEERYEFLTKVYEPEYINVLILDIGDYKVTDSGFFPTKSLLPLMESHLCFCVLPNGGLKCLKDRYDYYGRGNIFFGL